MQTLPWYARTVSGEIGTIQGHKEKLGERNIHSGDKDRGRRAHGRHRLSNPSALHQSGRFQSTGEGQTDELSPREAGTRTRPSENSQQSNAFPTSITRGSGKVRVWVTAPMTFYFFARATPRVASWPRL
jgi:hypothetical protein